MVTHIDTNTWKMDWKTGKSLLKFTYELQKLIALHNFLFTI